MVDPASQSKLVTELGPEPRFSSCPFLRQGPVYKHPKSRATEKRENSCSNTYSSGVSVKKMLGMGLFISHFFQMSSKLLSQSQVFSAHRLRSSWRRQTGPCATLGLNPVFLLNALASGHGRKFSGSLVSFCCISVCTRSQKWGWGSSWKKSKAFRSQLIWQKFANYHLRLNLRDV